MSVAGVEVLEETKAAFCSKTLLRMPAEPGGLRSPFTAACRVLSSVLNSLKAAMRVSVIEILFSSRSIGIRLTAIEASMMAAVSRPEKIGRAHVRTTVTNAHLVCRLLLEKKKKNITINKKRQVFKKNKDIDKYQNLQQ